MCGICCILTKINSNGPEPSTVCPPSRLQDLKLEQLLSNRGPDISGKLEISVDRAWKAYFESHVLWMQGNQPTHQPIVDEFQNILLWNGDIFNTPNDASTKSLCDTTVLSNQLSEATLSNNPEDEILKCISQIEGPWCFIFWHAKKNELWFGRDAMGRHSLLWSRSLCGGLILTSVATRQELPTCRELPAAGIFVATLKDDNLPIRLYPWNTANMKELESIYHPEDFPPDLQICQNSSLLSPYTLSNLEIPKENDKFICALNNLNNFSEPRQIFDHLLQDEEIYERVKKLFECLTSAVNVRCKTQPQLCKFCVSSKLENPTSNSKIICCHSKVAVLFSGGLDSAVVAAVADKCVPPEEPIDLINIAFQLERNISAPISRKEKRKQENQDTEHQCQAQVTFGPHTNAKFDVPDRLTGKRTYDELVAISPHRTWNFIEVNVTKTELIELRTERVADLIFPRCSVLDDSLGCAVWFASRGKGTLHRPDRTTQQNYTSPARVLLLGMGADELLGGYKRCRKMLSRNEDWSQIAQSLNHDLIALPTRNLGRDDRVTCDSGRQARFPFLAENVVRLLVSLPAHLRTAPLPGLPEGVGEKLLLRLLAAHLGIHAAAQAPKRALQFGSKVAGLEARNEKGDDICSRLLLSS